ncbi:hypothetical protein LSAT2_003966 [Lamellibrachia satsuma]|nr:hypothetical protein LSAT2_003966 [Lamellibrachia satsuma]
MRLRGLGRPTMAKCNCCTTAGCRRLLVAASFIVAGVYLGVMLNHYGVIFEHIRVDLHIDDVINKADAAIRSTGNNSDFVVPNIVHFIWFGKDRKMSFVHYISILSAHKIQRPDAIFVHCDHLPVGDWWQRLWRRVPLKLVHREAPRDIHNQTLMHMYHRADVAKIQILMEYGGIYLDYDVIVVRSLDPLRKYDVTLGKEKPPKFIAGIIVARRNALFLRLWYNSYRANYRQLDWDYNCARVTYQLYLKRPDLLHVEPYRLTTPDWQDRHLLWKEVIAWRDLYVIHAMMHFDRTEYTPENIRQLNSTFGEVVRYIYYGSPKTL